MSPRLGDRVHFRSVCVACNKMGRQHFTFVIDDPPIMDIPVTTEAAPDFWDALVRRM